MEKEHEFLKKINDLPPGKIDPLETGNVFKALAYNYLKTKRGVSMKGVSGAPDWLAFETALFK